MRMRLLLLGLSVALAIGTVRAEMPIAGQPDNGGRRINVPAPDDGTSRGITGASADQNPHVLKFFNGDTLHGRLLAATGATGLRWGSTDARAVIDFALGNVATVQLGGGKVRPGAQVGTRVALTNGDELRGTIVSLDGESLVLDTWYAGAVTIRRAMIKSLQPNRVMSATIYEGPNGAEEWRTGTSERGWVYRNGALYANGSGGIGRDVKLPDRARIEFDMAWRAYPSFQLAVYTDNLEAVYGNCYVLQFNGNSVYMQRGSRNNFRNLGGGANIENWQRRNKARVTLLVDKTKKTLTLLVDGALVKQWMDSDEFAGRGTGLMFYAQGQGVMRLSNIVVSEWDGELGKSEPTTATTADAIQFVNNDKVSGQLKTIAKNQVTFVTPFATLEVPLDRVAEIQFASDKAERARRQAADIRALFQTGGSVTVTLEKLDDQSLTGSSENFGQRTFAREAFGELQFNIYDERATVQKSDDDWGEPAD